MLLTFSAVAYSQAITAKAVGAVADPSGAVVANAKVEIRHEPGGRFGPEELPAV